MVKIVAKPVKRPTKNKQSKAASTRTVRITSFTDLKAGDTLRYKNEKETITVKVSDRYNLFTGELPVKFGRIETYLNKKDLSNGYVSKVVPATKKSK